MNYGLKNKLEEMRLKLRLRWLTTKFFFDKPRLFYQPLPWCGIETAKRDNGSRQRLVQILRELGDTKGSVLDVGSSVGFFSIALAEQGNFVTGIEGGKRNFDISQCAAAMADVKTASFVNMEVTAKTVKILPRFDFVFCLSIWHHWIRYFGIGDAMSILESLWHRTGNSIFFDTGLDELPEYFNIPEFEIDPDAWLNDKLQTACPGGEVRIIGQSNAFPSEQFLSTNTKKENSSVTRNLYCIKRRI